MIYTVIYKDDSDMMGTLTFAPRYHSKEHAWTEFIEEYATEGQSPMAIMPGNHVIYFPQDLLFVEAV